MKCPEAHTRKILQQLALFPISVQVRPRLATIDLLADPASRALTTLGSGTLSRQGRIAHFDESHLGSIFFGVIDELTVVPVAGGNVVALDRDRRGPSSATTCRDCQIKHSGEAEEKGDSLETELSIPRRSERMLKTGAGRRSLRHSAEMALVLWQT